MTFVLGFAVGSSTRVQYAAKRRQVFSVGSRGSEPGSFTWPRGVATGPENSIVVADSSNHRVQVSKFYLIFQIHHKFFMVATTRQCELPEDSQTLILFKY